ncbi:Werner Syndrome-like exonuclease [Apostasia shenzhenica]|uniref:3'-5' exonuclease n=1 Tax=Apostasia shenzhenica TaxID=1088818 RepID=A0A2H9ZSE4_9ASPA|nr:Werner Syndrome-like exonuclease [Apostasia shenzhenica]
MVFDSDWDEEAEEELRAIEAAYASAKQRRSEIGGGGGGGSGGGEESSLTQRRRLPHWANAAATSRSDVGHSRKVDGSPGSCPRSVLWHLSPAPCTVDTKLRYPTLTFGGRIVYCRTSSEVEQATMEISDRTLQLKHSADEISLGFDIEWKPIFTRGEESRKTAVLQICVDSSNCYVMHIIHSGIPPALKLLLEDSSSFKVGIGIAGDAMKIYREYDIRVASLIDLSRYANLKFGGTRRNWGLCSLTERVTCKQLPKPSKIRLGNWEADELSMEQLHYAATDAFASWYLYQVLKTFPDPEPEACIGGDLMS